MSEGRCERVDWAGCAGRRNGRCEQAARSAARPHGVPARHRPESRVRRARRSSRIPARRNALGCVHGSARRASRNNPRRRRGAGSQARVAIVTGRPPGTANSPLPNRWHRARSRSIWIRCRSRDDWLKRRARRNKAQGASRLFVVGAGRRVGLLQPCRRLFFKEQRDTREDSSFAWGSRCRSCVSPALRSTATWQGKGARRRSVLQGAVLRATGAARTIGVRAILVHAISGGCQGVLRKTRLPRLTRRADDPHDYDR